MALHQARSFDSIRGVFAASFIALLLGFATGGAEAQVAGIMQPGDTIVTGFSGVLAAPPPYPSGNAIDETFIDLDGPSMQIQRPTPAAPPAGQLIAAPTVFSVPARKVGQVFAITLDDQPVPNIYLGATSAFGLEIVAPDNDGNGRPQRITTGEPDATFMAGQWGAGGAPGSIYKVDGTTGAVSLFTSIGADDGPGIGDVVFDKASRQFFASDLDTGLIYRLDATGTILDTFDHGLAGRPAHGLAPVADDGSAMSVTDPAFNAEDPATWGYTQKERMVWGMATHNGRLYYAVADGPQVWSVGINLDGTFAGDPRWELDVAGLPSTNPISDMVFDGDGRMILAQRGLQRGSYDYSVFAEPLQSSVVRYRREIPDDPATPGVWVPVADQYAIGFRPDGLNATGGVALGYGFDANGNMHNGACGQFLWSTGESLRDNPALASQLAAGGPAKVDGLQGNDRDLVRPQNDPPFSSYFTDYDVKFDDTAAQGHMGDVEVWQPCVGYTPPYFPPPPPPKYTFNLTVEKQGYPCASLRDSLYCGFTIRVKNTGTTPYWGPVTVDDWLPGTPAGAVMTFTPQPPWVCGGVGPDDYQCTYPPVFLMPGDSLDLFLVVKLPPSYQPCSLGNAVRIVWPFGWADANPGDDFAYAGATIPGKRCEPSKTPKTNLKLQKFAWPKVCTDTGANWLCQYLVAITNTGPGIFNGAIDFTDTLSAGTLVSATAPWTCVPAGPAYTCTDPSATINPTATIFTWLTVTVPKVDQERAGKCSIVNDATISQPLGSPKNTIPTDDHGADEALTPGKNCEPVGKRSDLSVKKDPIGCVPYTFDDKKSWACFFRITVKNEGPDAFFASIALHDTTVPAALPQFFSDPSCVPDSGGFTCTTPSPVFLPPTASRPPLSTVVMVPDDGQTCHVTNTATITLPLGPSLNTVAVNDSSSVTIDIPSPQCQPHVEILKSEFCPADLKKPGGGCCPDGHPWKGLACQGDEAPTCAAGQTGTYPNCTTPPTPTCRSGYTGTYPNCVKEHARKPTCQYGGTYPNCNAKPSCGAGTTGTYPDCRPIAKTCPDNTTGTYPNCTPKRACPSGYTGTYWPNCTKKPSTTGGGTTLLPLTTPLIAVPDTACKKNAAGACVQ